MASPGHLILKRRGSKRRLGRTKELLNKLNACYLGFICGKIELSAVHTQIMQLAEMTSRTTSKAQRSSSMVA
jgi:hypothetical protein